MSASTLSIHRARRLVRRALVPTGAAAAAVVLTALPASAHVSVSSPDAAPGGFGALVFRVPTESKTASTTALTVRLPADAPFGSVLARPVPGWTVTTTERKLAKPVTDDDGFTLSKVVGTVTWTAGPGKGVGPGEFNEFELSVGPFPEKLPSLALPVVQRYSDGSVVRWDQPTPAGGDEPEHPAPVLDLSGAGGSDEHPASPSASPSARPSVRAEGLSTGLGDSSDGVARGLGGIGVALGLVAVAVAVSGRRRA